MPSVLYYLFKPKFLHMTLLGFVAGIPLYLIFSSLSLWLDQVGVAKSEITYFSWAALAYSFKFLWSPLVDKLPIPVLSRIMGQRRAWLLVVQILIMSAIVWMAMTNPAAGDGALLRMAMATVLLGFSSATQDILIDAWRIEASTEKDIAMLSSVYIVGYRLGMITSGAGALFIAGYLGTAVGNYQYQAWQISYLIMACVMLVGIATTLAIKEPPTKQELVHSTRDYLGVLLVFVFSMVVFVMVYWSLSDNIEHLSSQLSAVISNTILIDTLTVTIRLLVALMAAFVMAKLIGLSGFVNQAMMRSVYVQPVADLFERHRRYIVLLVGIIALYRVSDIVMGVSANLFYQHMGFSLDEIAGIVKTFGLVMTLTGGLIGGVLVVKFGILRIMLIGAVLSSLTNLLFMVMAGMDKSVWFLALMISADNLSAGLAMTAFVGFLSLLVNRRFTAVQYAMFSSVMTLFPKILGGYSGGMVETLGFGGFFLMTAIIGLPVILMLLYAIKVKAFEFTASADSETEKSA
ncbi:AmpG family muropeptide MFS transporter [Marinicella gelatinilytica]|uniref:AmpG family muropeptide MFS transporter n=1 Tax=Marinicella gelatinilytica TaxID=2996017 RepID=UPI002260E177|nr:MFS transporter [Marinicella gelatinilytica]MCX7545230.1 MFS transporter [Marinicella gelatinilytica]